MKVEEFLKFIKKYPKYDLKICVIEKIIDPPPGETFAIYEKLTDDDVIIDKIKKTIDIYFDEKNRIVYKLNKKIKEFESQ